MTTATGSTRGPLLVGLDPSTKRTGVVLLDVSSRSIDHHVIRPPGSWATERRAEYMAHGVGELVVDPAIIDLFAEAIGTSMVQTAIAFGRVHQAIARVIAERSPLDRRIDQAYGTVPPSTLKKWATGNGKADKPAMVAAARLHWPDVDLSEDEADAALVALWGEQRLQDEGVLE